LQPPIYSNGDWKVAAPWGSSALLIERRVLTANSFCLNGLVRVLASDRTVAGNLTASSGVRHLRTTGARSDPRPAETHGAGGLATAHRVNDGMVEARNGLPKTFDRTTTFL
jgi:hypothetical protein